MKLCRFGEGSLGCVVEDAVHDVSDALKILPRCEYPLPPGDLLVAHLPAVMQEVRRLLPSSRSRPVGEVTLLSPVANPSKIIGAPINYQDHVEESVRDAGIAHGRKIGTLHEWGLFLKSSTSLIGFGQEIRLRHPQRRNDQECELAVVVGRECSNIAAAYALDYVAGYAIGLDMTLRGPEFQCWRKSIDTYSVLGPWLVSADEIDDPDRLDLQLRVNDEVRQDSNTRHLVVNVRELLALASSMYTLYPGDILMTGTPAGVGPVVPGDVLHARIQGLGAASVRIAAGYAS